MIDGAIRRLMALLCVLVLVAFAIRLIWELLAPAIVPMAILATVGMAVYVLWRRR